MDWEYITVHSNKQKYIFVTLNISYFNNLCNRENRQNGLTEDKNSLFKISESISVANAQGKIATLKFLSILDNFRTVIFKNTKTKVLPLVDKPFLTLLKEIFE